MAWKTLTANIEYIFIPKMMIFTSFKYQILLQAVIENEIKKHGIECIIILNDFTILHCSPNLTLYVG